MGRESLAHQWSQGDYIDGGALDGRIDWDALSTLEAEAKQIIDETVQNYDTAITGFSGGIDCTVLLHMLSELGYEDVVPSVSIVNPMYHSCIQTWCEAFPQAFGFETDLDYNENRDMEWVKEHAETCLYPTWGNKQFLLNSGYRTHFREYNDQHDIDVFFSGRRNEVNVAGSYFKDKWGSVECRPIYMWSIEHVIAYCDKYDLPISPFYFEFPTTGGYPWYRRRLWSRGGTQIRTKEQWWYWTRRICLRAGHTDFWKRISDAFPQSEGLASQHAAKHGLLFLDTSSGYEYGLDAVDDPLNAEPAHLDTRREQLINPDDSHAHKDPEGNYLEGS